MLTSFPTDPLKSTSLAIQDSDALNVGAPESRQGCDTKAGGFPERFEACTVPFSLELLWHVRCFLFCDHLQKLERGVTFMPAQQPLDDVLRRVQGEYIEMPGLRLTTAQAQRLWGLDRAACDALLGALVDAKFLSRTRDGAFMRSDQARATRT